MNYGIVNTTHIPYLVPITSHASSLQTVTASIEVPTVDKSMIQTIDTDFTNTVQIEAMHSGTHQIELSR